MKNNNTGKFIKDNIQRLIDKKIIKTEKGLNNPTLTQIEKIAHELDICIMDIICCYCPHEDCIIDGKQLCKYEKL
ncbi:hypothetical protein [Clostridium sporogenes]|uniref:hypothetical protein n=1 Tax=Clostridium sporogenes TaxID=1509 RepID=UPI0005F00953|nr:hypothetical protein [Clostridium sporogenes]MBY7014692.1 hypothetical protein [Clostridium sporogenes]NFD93951.1 hypothetical protein [Clostridium sporogenes]NFE44860.1 hypothetical protein [Clostridium sporogenes]NFF15709.1 hypothetical protein [Clostridium sporogenes]NFF73405.1 hypothetical protein [Clostridium sporogenes]